MKTKSSEIFVLEGVYSMEGHIAKLPEFIRLAKELRFYRLGRRPRIWVLGNQEEGSRICLIQ